MREGGPPPSPSRRGGAHPPTPNIRAHGARRSEDAARSTTPKYGAGPSDEWPRDRVWSQACGNPGFGRRERPRDAIRDPRPAARKRENEGGNFATALVLVIVCACRAGGGATLIGTPPNAFLAGFFSESYGVEAGVGAGVVPAWAVGG